jgi:hypothetical protein
LSRICRRVERAFAWRRYAWIRKKTMYELISVENGDVLFASEERQPVADALVEYVDRYRAGHALEEQIALIETDAAGCQVGPAIFYAELLGQHQHEALA